MLEIDTARKNLLDIKQEMHIKRRQSPYFMSLDDKKRDIDRYSDKYQLSHQESHSRWTPGVFSVFLGDRGGEGLKEDDEGVVSVLVAECHGNRHRHTSTLR